MALCTRLSLPLHCHRFKGRALKFHSRGGEPGTRLPLLMSLTFPPGICREYVSPGVLTHVQM